MTKPKFISHNCSKCGRFVGKGGHLDVFYDDYNGGYEMGYPLCKRCYENARGCGEALVGFRRPGRFDSCTRPRA